MDLLFAIFWKIVKWFLILGGVATAGYILFLTIFGQRDPEKSLEELKAAKERKIGFFDKLKDD